MKSKVWTPEKIEMIKSYLQMGLSKKQIVKKLDCTLDALSGAITRYGLEDCIIITEANQKRLANTDFVVLAEENFEELKKKAKLQWKVPKTILRSSSKKPYRLGFIWPDTHVPHQDTQAVNILLQILSDYKFDIFVNVGDFLDYGPISHHNKGKHKTLEMQRLKSDYIEGNAILDEIDVRLPKNCEKHFLKGNHELWVNDLLEEMPQLEGLIEPESQLFLKERGYKLYGYNDLAKFGRLFITHGIYASSNPIKKHLDELKCNVCFGHTHSLGMMLSSSPAREIAFSGYNVGCVCNLSPDYMRNSPHKWAHGCAVFYLFPNGYFDVQLIRIVEGKAIFNNKVYIG